MTETTALQEVLAIQSEESLKDRLLFEHLAAEINTMIKTNFEQLVQLLYRIDVNEVKLKALLQANPNQDAGVIIAHLLIERQLQKIKLREQFSQNRQQVDDEEKW
jgi:hypothetical protein